MDDHKTLAQANAVKDGLILETGTEEFTELRPEIPEVIPSWSPVNYSRGYQL